MKILFVKTSSLGDVIHHCPAASDAARRYPGIEIDWVVEEAFAAVPSMHGSVRRTIPVALRRWRTRLGQRSTWAEFAAFRAAISRERYDCVVDSQGLLKSAFLCRLANAGEVHGFDRASAREPLATLFYTHKHRVSWDAHAVDRNRRLTAAALDYAVTEPLAYDLRVGGNPPSANPPFIFLTMTARSEKLWPEAHWIELGRALGGAVVLPWGSPAERARAQRVAAAVPGASVPDHMTLEALARLLVGSRGVIGVDTGLTHLAAALNVPALAIFCGTESSLYGLRGTRVRNLGGKGRVPSVAEVLKELP